MIKAVIFDLYGTLLQSRNDSRPFHQLARRRKGGNLRSILEMALTTELPTLADFVANIGLSNQDDLPALNAALQDDIASIRPFPDVVPTLDTLKKRGILTALISNLGTPYKQPFISHQLDALFDVTVFSCDCGLLKPNRKIYELALEQLGTSAAETIMVGDSFKSDVEGPSKIGIKGIHLVRSGGSSRSDSVISSLHALLKRAT